VSQGIDVRCLQPSDEADYQRFVDAQPASLVYASLAFRNFLSRVTNGEDRYLIAVERNAVVGVLPAFLQPDRGHGAVLNSLPFFGSIGGVLAARGRDDVAAALLDGFDRVAADAGCISRTIITSPLDPDTRWYERHVTFREKRNCQITPLPEAGADLDERLLASFEDPRPRNIRRASKSGVTVVERWDDEALRFLASVHAENIGALGGIVKPLDVFLAVAACFDRSQYSVFVASRDGHEVAALLTFFFNGTVEYFTPATVHDERSNQPLSLVIFEAMKRAAERGCRRWNWGGTWATQTTLYDFKKRWGAVDHPYWYFTTVDDAVLDRTREDILAAHPYYYVCPFEALRHAVPRQATS
jgi:Acetyltransferase (GNAT) domain